MTRDWKITIYFAWKIKGYCKDLDAWDYYYDRRHAILYNTNDLWFATDDLWYKEYAMESFSVLGFNYWWPDYYREHWMVYGGMNDHKKTFFDNTDNIEASDILFVYINTMDSYWTLSEIWFAKALRKKIYIAYTEDIDEEELWFVLQFADETVKVKDHKEWWDKFTSSTLRKWTKHIQDIHWYYELHEMDYKEFLETDYRKKLSKEVKKNAGNKCQACWSKKRLETHHSSYDNRWIEWKEIDDLVCLCHKCHEKIHWEWF